MKLKPHHLGGGHSFGYPRGLLPISDDEYKSRFAVFLAENGGGNDPDMGFFGNAARYAMIENEFQRMLKLELLGP